MKKQNSQPLLPRSSSATGIRAKSSRMNGHPLASKFKREKDKEENEPKSKASHRSPHQFQDLLLKKKLKKKSKKPPKARANKVNFVMRSIEDQS